MVDKFKIACKKIGEFFTGLFNLTSYTEHQREVNKSLGNISSEMKKIADGLKANTTATTDLAGKITKLDGEIVKIKDGLQLELSGSLQTLHARLKEQKFATPEQKREAELFYNKIHALGKDGWSKRYHEEIIEMPESREDYWKTLN